MNGLRLTAKPVTRLCSAGVVLALSACAIAPTGPNVMVLPGAQKSPQQYQADLGTCRQQAQAQVAPAVEAANNQAAANAVIGTALGAAFGALVGYGGYGSYGNYANQAAAWGAGTGLLYGGAVGSSYSQAANPGLQQRYDAAYAQCMVIQGNQLPGQTAYRRAAPALPPPPPGYRPPNTLPPNIPPRNTLPPAMPPPNTPPPVGVLAPA